MVSHLSGRDDELSAWPTERVPAVLSRMDYWGEVFIRTRVELNIYTDIKKHNRTGRPLGGSQFVTKLEALTGRVLAPGKPDPRPKCQRQVYCPWKRFILPKRR